MCVCLCDLQGLVPCALRAIAHVGERRRGNHGRTCVTGTLRYGGISHGYTKIYPLVKFSGSSNYKS